jgi:hypothetical protein
VRTLEPMALTDLDAAPFRFTATARVDADPLAVFAELADPSQWFPLGKRTTWYTAATSGVGAIRDFDLHLLGSVREQMIAWEPGERLAYTVIGASSPLVSPLAERWTLAREGIGTRVEWTIAARFSVLVRPLAPALRGLLRPMFLASMRRLGKRAGSLSHATSPA